MLDKKLYSVKQIDYHLAMDVSIKNHYLHRKSPCSMAFGLYGNDEVLVGVTIFGVPPSHTLLKGICGDDEKRNVYELNRLWVDDSVPRNGESFFISQAIKMTDKEIIVSFADTSQGHIGYVYQATNFLYCGLSTKFRDPKIKGLEHQHHATYAHGMTNKQLIEKYGDDVYFVERPRKHKYILFNAKSKKRKKELLRKLRYKILPYPKTIKG